MSAFGQRPVLRAVTAAVAVVAVALVSTEPASAGIFERIFGGLRHAASEVPASLPTNLHAFADPLTGLERAINPPPARGETGPASAYCVRSCDGHYFPVHANAGASAADMCHAFCPGSQTKLYSGSNIDYAVATDGSRYADLDTAYVYRQQLVAGCTCNGHDAFGLAHVDVNSDPTLKPGDVVVTKSGLMAFTGTRTNKVADFTPVSTYGGFAKSYRDKLSELKISPPGFAAPDAVTSSIPSSAAARSHENHSARLDR
jgi:hypothetical protein